MSRKPQYSLAPPRLQVLDLGLDFRSYLSHVDNEGVPILGNIITYDAGIVADTFEPTVGVLVTILQLYASSSQISVASTWLKTYDTIQSVYLDQIDPSTPNEGARFAEEGRELIQAERAHGLPTEKRVLYNKLLSLLDRQCGMKGAQAPSQRKQQRDPKGAFCNLHLGDHKCYQDFACNQLHLHEAGPVRHRMLFFKNLAEILLDEGKPRHEVIYRVKDSIFFARYGNKVTVRCHGAWIPFFKTVYTDGRLEQAFRQQQFACNNRDCTNEHCKGIHAQDGRVPPSSKPMDIHNQPQVMNEIEEEAELIVASIEAQNPLTEIVPTPSSSATSMNDAWKNASVIRDYVRETGNATTEADEALLRTLQDANCAASITSSETPTNDDIGIPFNSSLSSFASDYHHS